MGVVAYKPVWRPDWRVIVDHIARRHGTTYEAAIARGPKRNALLAARIEIARALDAEGMTSTMIGRRINRDHTTVLWYLGRLHNPRRRKLP